jgi:phosphoribosylformimino-5-aminoimidazole carboxamide ribotide isomerase
MFLLPRIQLSRGQCVDAIEEPSEGEALPLTDPREVALRLQRMGAVGLHIVDVDHARGKKPNDKALVKILDAVTIPVQCGGGVTSLRRIQELRDTGVTRVVVGSMGVLHPDWMKEAAKCFPKGLVANLDEKEGHVLAKGQAVDTGKSVEDLALEFDSFGFEGLVLTSLLDSEPGRMLDLVRRLKTPTMLDRRVKTIADLVEFKNAGTQAAILGPEIYDRTIDFAEASKYMKTL